MSEVNQTLLKADGFELGTVSPVDGTISDWKKVAVYQNTLNIEEEDPEITQHKESGKRSAKKVITIEGAETAVFQMMDSDPDSMVIALGGTVTTLDQKKAWNKPKGYGATRIVALRATTVDNYQYIINKGTISGKKVFEFSETGIALFECRVMAMDTGFDAIPDVQWKQV